MLPLAATQSPVVRWSGPVPLLNSVHATLRRTEGLPCLPLPPPVLAALKRGETVEPDFFDETTVLFRLALASQSSSRLSACLPHQRCFSCGVRFLRPDL